MSVRPMVEFILDFKQKDIDPKYREYLTKVRAMTGAGIVNVLNKTSSFIDEDKCYLEIGIHRGSTLIGASLGNKVNHYGVDSFEGHASKEETAPFNSVEEGLQDAIVKLGGSNLAYFKQDYKEFFKGRTEVEGKKVEVYFYDGDHQYENQYEGLRLAIPVLANEAVVFVDDSANNDREAVWKAINRLLKEDSRFRVIKEFIPRNKEMHGDFWCGLVALKFSQL
jgi:hypothetical protein